MSPTADNSGVPSPNNTSDIVAQIPSVLHEGGAPERVALPTHLNLTKNSTSEYGDENRHARRISITNRKHQQAKDYIELEEYAPVNTTTAKKKKKKSPNRDSGARR